MEGRNDLNRPMDAGMPADRGMSDPARGSGFAREVPPTATPGMKAGAAGTLDAPATGATERAEPWRTTIHPDDGSSVADRASGLVDRAKTAVTDAASRATHKVTDAAGHAVDEAKHRVSDRAAGLRDAAGERLERVRGPLLGSALGAIVGSLAGALGGWWAGRRLSDSEFELAPDDEQACYAHFVALTVRPVESFDEARSGYALGHAAARNPSYRGRPFHEVEPELRRGFTGAATGEYDTLRDFARFGYERGTGLGGSTGTTGGL